MLNAPITISAINNRQLLMVKVDSLAELLMFRYKE